MVDISLRRIFRKVVGFEMWGKQETSFQDQAAFIYKEFHHAKFVYVLKCKQNVQQMIQAMFGEKWEAARLGAWFYIYFDSWLSTASQK